VRPARRKALVSCWRNSAPRSASVAITQGPGGRPCIRGSHRDSRGRR
jgi:hypothetical protein